MITAIRNCSGFLIEHIDGVVECSLGGCRGRFADSQHVAGASCGWARELLPGIQAETRKRGIPHRCARCDRQTKEAA